MRTPAAAIHAYLRAKDSNRPHLMAKAFCQHAMLSMQVRTSAISFPPLSCGREAITEVLVRRFGQSYDNVYTFCLAAPPRPAVSEFSCNWLVAMTDKASGEARVGCGRYDWRFAPASGLAERLDIAVEVMVVLPPEAARRVLDWVAALPYPWCGTAEAIAGAAIAGVAPVMAWLVFNDAPPPSGRPRHQSYEEMSYERAHEETDELPDAAGRYAVIPSRRTGDGKGHGRRGSGDGEEGCRLLEEERQGQGAGGV